jgi:hypothetical protein
MSKRFNKATESTSKVTKPAKSTKVKPVISSLVPVEATEENETIEPNTSLALSSDAPKSIAKIETPKALPDGYVNYTCVDTDGTVFTTCQAASRKYISAVLADSPLGRIVARWTSDGKAAVRYGRAIDLQLKGGTPGMSNAYVADVKVAEIVPEGASRYTRTSEAHYYGTMGMVGPNFHARELAKMQRLAQAALLAQNAEVHGPVQQNA